MTNTASAGSTPQGPGTVPAEVIAGGIDAVLATVKENLTGLAEGIVSGPKPSAAPAGAGRETGRGPAPAGAVLPSPAAEGMDRAAIVPLPLPAEQVVPQSSPDPGPGDAALSPVRSEQAPLSLADSEESEENALENRKRGQKGSGGGALGYSLTALILIGLAFVFCCIIIPKFQKGRDEKRGDI
jgi:hypothetical protein